MKKVALGSLLLLSACSRATEQRKQKCMSLRIGMPEAELFSEMGRPAETIAGDQLTTYVWGHRMHEETMCSATIVMETRKVKTVIFGDASVRNFNTERDAQDFKDQENGEKAEGRRILSDVGGALSELNRRSRGRNGEFAAPYSGAELESRMPDKFLPEFEVPYHEKTRAFENYAGDVCKLEGLNWPKFDESKLKDSGKWGLVVDGPCAGRVFVDCTHYAGFDRKWYQVR